MTLLYVIVNGIFFAVLQSGYFFALGTRMTSAYPGFLTVTLGWLIGSALGLQIGHKVKSSFWVGLSLAAYLATFWGLTFLAYDSRFLPLSGAMVAFSGLYAGAFFRVNRSLLGTASRLFFWENNGFIAGWVIGFAGFVWGGIPLLLWLPGLLGAGILACGYLSGQGEGKEDRLFKTT